MTALLVVPLYLIVAVMVIYTIRHYAFTLNRLFGRHRQPYVDIGRAPWPRVAVFVPCHNEERVIAHMLDALLAGDYPAERQVIIPIDDRSSDGTARILADYAARFPDRVAPYTRTGGRPGKAAALKEASAQAPGAEAELHLVFDADYLPGRGLVKQLAAPFFDPEVGAVMGRVVPINVNRTLLTRLLDLERTGGYQVDQQARMNLRLVPQYGGTVGGVRRAALLAAGGWRDDTLAEDTDMTFRLVLAGWEIAYQNRSECYEEVPETWPSRIAQIKRWARGHNQSLARYGWKLLRAGGVPLRVRLDGFLLLGVYAVGPLLMLGWGLALVLYYLGIQLATGMLAIFAVALYSTLGNFAAFFEVAAGARLDGSRGRVKLLPFLIIGFLVSLVSVTWATLQQLATFWRRGDQRWEKTQRFRPAGAALPNGDAG